LRAEGERIVGDVAPVADGQEDLVETFLDFILERMVAEALLVRVGGGGDEERLRLNGEAALSLASMGLLRLLPVRDDFAPKDVLEEFLGLLRHP
jgi:hypothetical protein